MKEQRRKPNARQLAMRRIGSSNWSGLLTHQEVRQLSSAYLRSREEVKRLKMKIAKLEAKVSDRISAAYEHGAEDARSRYIYRDHDMGQ